MEAWGRHVYVAAANSTPILRVRHWQWPGALQDRGQHAPDPVWHMQRDEHRSPKSARQTLDDALKEPDAASRCSNNDDVDFGHGGVGPPYDRC
jgi:hypothetical protein